MNEFHNTHSEPETSMRRFTTIIARGDNWFVAHCPELGVLSQGRTEIEARQNLQEVIERHLNRFGEDWEDGSQREAC